VICFLDIFYLFFYYTLNKSRSPYYIGFNFGRGKDIVLKNVSSSPAPVAHTYNPSYSGGRDQEDCSSKPVQGK
jgi:hypothetical protein